MSRRRRAQEYSQEEFDAAVALIQTDPALRADIEAIVGQSLDGRSPRELFDAFRAIEHATRLQLTVAEFGRARQLIRQTRNTLEELPPPDMPPSTAAYVEDLQTRFDQAKARVRELEAANAALRAGRVTPISRVVKGEVAS
ncbi:hypothetical protein [Sphaerimonospora mesophila]|uniref:hypothetical protein n=1 Tax=Sphaerimonospora mesophila TaxID=37483 RepID=UPI000A6696F7